MKVIAFANRLSRYLNVTNFPELDANGRLEILDAINGGLQKMHAVGPDRGKVVPGSITAPAPVTVSIGVTNGSTAFTVATVTAAQYHRTIRISGDDIDNQIVSSTALLHPYSGTTGTVSAVIYGDAAQISEPLDQIVGELRNMDTHRFIPGNTLPNRVWTTNRRRQICEPWYFFMDDEAINRNPSAPSYVRFDPIPDRLYRFAGKFTTAPVRIKFEDLLSSATPVSIPLRAEMVELYLLPIARGILTASELWKDPTTKTPTAVAGEAALSRYALQAPRTLATPNNTVGTPHGF